MTNPFLRPQEGFGCNYSFIIASIVHAEIHNEHFLYTPFNPKAHNCDADPDFLMKLERIINLIDYFPINHDIRFQKDCKYPGRSPTPDDYYHSKSLKLIKMLFFANKEKTKFFRNEFTNIAIHIRKENSHDTLDVPHLDQFYCKLIDLLRKRTHLHPPIFHIYSQGNLEGFKIFQSNDVVLHLNESIEDTFSSMAFSDILVPAPSCLSYVAGMISNGLILYFPCPQRNPLPNWERLPISI